VLTSDETDHHNDEEEHFFPWIEEAAGEKGLMDVNVEQHSRSNQAPSVA
jgi:hypothetical protein